MLVQKSAQNDSIKNKLEEALCVVLEGFTLKRTKHCKKNVKKMMHSTITSMVHKVVQARVHLRVHLKVHLRMHFRDYFKKQLKSIRRWQKGLT